MNKLYGYSWADQWEHKRTENGMYYLINKKGQEFPLMLDRPFIPCIFATSFAIDNGNGTVSYVNHKGKLLGGQFPYDAVDWCRVGVHCRGYKDGCLVVKDLEFQEYDRYYLVNEQGKRISDYYGTIGFSYLKNVMWGDKRFCGMNSHFLLNNKGKEISKGYAFISAPILNKYFNVGVVDTDDKIKTIFIDKYGKELSVEETQLLNQKINDAYKNYLRDEKASHYYDAATDSYEKIP